MGPASLIPADYRFHRGGVAVPARAAAVADELNVGLAGIIRLGGVPSKDLPVSLEVSDTNEVTVPEIVTILAGQSYAVVSEPSAKLSRKKSRKSVARRCASCSDGAS